MLESPVHIQNIIMTLFLKMVGFASGFMKVLPCFGRYHRRDKNFKLDFTYKNCNQESPYKIHCIFKSYANSVLVISVAGSCASFLWHSLVTALEFCLLWS